MWDLVDGAATPDESPGVDDEPGDGTGSSAWPVITNYMTTLVPPGNWITIEDFYTGWFVEHGAGFMQAEIDSAFIGLGCMKFEADSFEPDDTLLQANVPPITTYSVSGGGGVVISECELGAEDQIELQNTGTTAVDLTGWTLTAYRNSFPAVIYTFPSFTLYPGCVVDVHERGDPGNDTPVHVYGGGAFSVVWANGGDGAATLANNIATAVDFVSWTDIGGTPNSEPVPSGLTYTGTVASPPGGKVLARDVNGTDTDDASDFTEQAPSLGAPNVADIPFYTVYPLGDQDLIRIDLTAGDLVVVRAEAPHSAGEPQLELLDNLGDPIAINSAKWGFSRLAEIQFLAPANGTYYVRLTHIGDLTDWAPVRLSVVKRPDSGVLLPAEGLTAIPENLTDVGDQVDLAWLNGGAYDSVSVYRDSTSIAVLPGSATSYSDFADRGQHEYRVAGMIGVAESALSEPGFAFSGVLTCYGENDLESGTAGLALDSPWDLTSSIAEAGTFSLTDSPGGDYGNSLEVSAEFTIPTALITLPTLEFDHICITEATFDFGIVEVSTDFGNNWTELIRYDMDDHAGWNDGAADPGDWVHESLNLSAYLNKKLTVRFRLSTDAFVQEDGWYVDNLAVSDTACLATTSVPEERVLPTTLVLAGPNPFRDRLGMSLAARPGSPARVAGLRCSGAAREHASGRRGSSRDHPAPVGRPGCQRPARGVRHLSRPGTYRVGPIHPAGRQASVTRFSFLARAPSGNGWGSLHAINRPSCSNSMGVHTLCPLPLSNPDSGFCRYLQGVVFHWEAFTWREIRSVTHPVWPGQPRPSARSSPAIPATSIENVSVKRTGRSATRWRAGWASWWGVWSGL